MEVLIVGPGFIGWNVLDILVSEGYKVTGLVRRKEHAAGIEKSGAKFVMGDLNDHDLIADLTHKSDIVFHTATADHLPSVEAVLSGVRKRIAEEKQTIFIHTSGTSVLDDGADGAYLNEKIYYDNKPEEIDSLADDAPHRPVDLAIVRASKEFGDKAKLAIMIPPEIYGFNPKHQRLSIQVPTLTQFALKHGYTGHVGKGLSRESQIHVMDLARAYVVLLHTMEKSPPSFVLENPYFFCENGKEFSWLEVAQEIGKELHAAGKLADPEPRTIPEDSYQDLFGHATSCVIGLNSRSRAVRLRQLGWEPVEKGIWESFREDELPMILKEWKGAFSGWGGTVPPPK